jgi:LPS-assembly lipoprotein
LAALGFGVSAILSGCSDGSGFHPLYATSFGGAAVEEKLAKVDIAPIPGRVGQRVRNELIFQSTGGGVPLPPEYRLEIAINESLTSTLVKVDGRANAQVYNLDAIFTLVRIRDKAVILHGRSSSRAAFDRLTSIFANVEAQKDAENRAAKTLGEELRTRLLAALATPA